MMLINDTHTHTHTHTHTYTHTTHTHTHTHTHTPTHTHRRTHSHTDAHTHSLVPRLATLRMNITNYTSLFKREIKITQTCRAKVKDLV